MANVGQLKAVFSLRFDELDADNDGLLDSWEVLHFLNLRFGVDSDPDNDGLSNLQEMTMGSDPNTVGADTDQDGMPDDWELANAGIFAIYPPVMTARMLGGESVSTALMLRNDTDAAVSFTISVADNTAPVYSHADSLNGGIPFVWEDISSTGIRMPVISESDDVSEEIPGGFGFELFGQDTTSVFVCSNGFLTLGQARNDLNDIPLPDPSAPPGLIAPFWDDLNPGSGGDIYYQRFADRLIVQFQNVKPYTGSGTYTFQVVLYATGEIEFRYQSMTGATDSCTVGLQDSTGLFGLEVPSGAAYPATGIAIRFSPLNFFGIAPLTGTIPAHSSSSMAGTFHSLSLPASQHTAQVAVMPDGEGNILRAALARLTVLADSDSDGIPNAWEIQYGLETGTNDANGDPDRDGYTNLEEYRNGTDPLTPDNTADADNDGMWDHWETLNGLDPNVDDSAGDADSDGLTNLMEFQAGTNPGQTDSDSDGMPDVWEIAHSLNPLLDDSNQDADGDGITNLGEYQNTTDPQTPNDPTDLDGDSMLDTWEVAHGLDPVIDDSALDPDKDGLTNFQEFQLRTNPQDQDTDGDDLPDGWEAQYSLNPKVALGFQGATGDPDGDTLINLDEFLNGTSPVLADTDGDGTDDATEVGQGSDPNNAADGGEAPVDHVVDIPFKVYGDYAAWNMTVKGEGPRDFRELHVITPGVDTPEIKALKLWRNNRYKVTLSHTGSKQVADHPWYCWEARVEDKPSVRTFQDYSPDRIENAGNYFSIGDGHWVVDNRDGLFTDHNHRTETRGGNATAGLEAFIVPVGIEDNSFATGVDNASVISNDRNLRGYQEEFWIMAPCGGQEYNGMRFKIPLDPADNLRILTGDATPDPVNTTQGTADPGPVVTWKAVGSTTLDHTPDWQIGLPPHSTELAIRVKNMKYRTVTVAVFPVRDPQSGRAVVPLPPESVLQAKMDETFGVQLNAWISLGYRPQQDYDYDPDGDGYALTDDNPSLWQMRDQPSFSAPWADIRLFVIDNVHVLARQENVDNDNGSEIYGSSNRATATVFANAGNPTEGVRSPQEIVDTIAHEIGHIFVGSGHPDDYNIELEAPELGFNLPPNFSGPAPLPGTDMTVRLMSSPDARAPGARFLVKTEWDEAEDWLHANVDN